MLNCLGEGEYSALMKHFLKRFPAGADRFAGVGTFTAANGAYIDGLDNRRAQMIRTSAGHRHVCFVSRP